MKRQIRSGAFETNSSSTHTLVICTEEDFDAFRNGQKRINWCDEFVDVKTIDKEVLLRKAEEKYNNEKQSYWKDWDELGEEEKETFTKKVECESYERDYDCSDSESYDQFFDDYYLENFVKTFTTPSGDKMVAFGKYGYDG